MEISILKEEDILNYSSFKNRCLKIKEKYPYIVIKENNKF